MKVQTGIYDNIQLSPYNLEVINSFHVTKQLNTHDEALLTGIISEDILENYKNVVTESTIFSIRFKHNEKKQLLFSGFLLEMDVREINEQYEVTLHLAGLTKALDYRRWIHDYQDENKTGSGMIRKLMKGYPDITYAVEIEDKIMDKFLMQYEETDYEFITRFLSLENEPVYTRIKNDRGQIHFGNRKTDSVLELELVSYDVEFDTMAYEADKKNHMGATGVKEYLQYRTERKEFLQIGDRVKALGKELYVKGAEYSLTDGVSKNCYLLCEKDGLYVTKQYNSKMTGISLDGSIITTLRDRVKVELDITPKTGEEKARWFAYSTSASSQDGSGWYCMPEIGEQIRLYFPTDREEDAYVISAIRSGGDTGSSGSGDRTSTPQNKSLANKEGQEVKFTEDGTEITCAGGVAVMKLNKDGTLEITAMSDIDFTATNSISICSDGLFSMMANDKILLTNKTGSSFEMNENIQVTGNRIKNNS